MNNHQKELRKAIQEQIEYHETWYSLLSWQYVGRKVDFDGFPKKYPDYNIQDMIEGLKWQLHTIQEDDNEENMLQKWALFQYLLDNGKVWY